MASLKGDSALRDALFKFFDAAQLDVATGNLTSAIGIGSVPFRLLDGVIFREKPGTTDARREVISRCTKLLGTVNSHESDIDDLLWKVAARRARLDGVTNTAEATAEFIKILEQEVDQNFTFVDGNYLFGFDQYITSIQIGPVRAALTSVVSSELIAAHPNAKWNIATGQSEIFMSETGHVTTYFPNAVWSVTLKAAKKNVPEQAAWLIDIAVSLLRLSHKSAGPFFPGIGEVEAQPLKADDGRSTSLIMVGDRTSISGGATPKHYTIDATLVAHMGSKEVKAMDVLFSPRKGSVAERVSQGLGWMTRGRRSKDRSERLLFFFTAIEALLSNDDKTAPVTQTIARHAAVILATAADDRKKVAAQIKNLYAARSALVHAGKRNVSKSDADTVQLYTEVLYIRILECVDLGSDFQKLNEALSDASYGSPWP